MEIQPNQTMAALFLIVESFALIYELFKDVMIIPIGESPNYGLQRRDGDNLQCPSGQNLSKGK
jgi:hypothetical protein